MVVSGTKYPGHRGIFNGYLRPVVTLARAYYANSLAVTFDVRSDDLSRPPGNRSALTQSNDAAEPFAKRLKLVSRVDTILKICHRRFPPVSASGPINYEYRLDSHPLRSYGYPN